MKLIDIDALVAEIEKRRDICKKVVLDLRTQENKDYYQGKAEAYKETIDLLDTLEVKEVEESTAADRGTAEEIIINLKRVEKDYRIDLTKEITWLRNKVQKGE